MDGLTIEPQMANLGVGAHISDLMGHYEWHNLSALKRRRSAAKRAVQKAVETDNGHSNGPTELRGTKPDR